MRIRGIAGPRSSRSTARHRGPWLALLLVLALFAVGCESKEAESTVSGDQATASSQPTTTQGITYSSPHGTTRSTTAAPTTAPSSPPSTTGTSTEPAIATRCDPSNGFTPVPGGRRVLVRGDNANKPRPAVLVLHGFAGSPEQIEKTSGWTPFSRKVGTLVAYPEGTPLSTEGFGWSTGSARFSTTGVDDIPYLAAVVDHLVATACVDPNRIMITGESNGGAMTLLAACSPATAGKFRMFAPVIPAIDDGVLDRCGSGPPLSFLALAGRLDETVPYDGVYSAGQTPLLAQEFWFLQLAAARNGCGFGPPSRTAVPGGEAVRPENCPDSPTLVAVDDAPHTWPGGPTGNGGMNPGTFPATSYLWAIFNSS